MEPSLTIIADAAPTPATERPHVVLVASPGAGHIIPLVELARRFVKHHGFAATLVTFADMAAPDALSGLPPTVATAALPSVPLNDLPADARIETVLLEIVQRSVPNLRAILRSIGATAPLAALVPDFFCSSALPLAEELGIPGYLFVPCSLNAVAVMCRAVEINEGVATAGEYRDLPVPLELPGGVSLLRHDIPDGFRDSSEPVYARLIDEGRRYRRAGGFLVNTFYDVEAAAVEEFKQAAEQGVFPPAYPVGPFIRSNSDEVAGAGESSCLEWLDNQPNDSVVYVSFGSGGSLSVEQTAELAAGLEASGRRFLWVVRMPKVDAEGDDDHRKPLEFLPEGFLERTSGRGLAVASWAPQVRILSHPATAAFLSHCGWNSTLESLAAGVPMIPWPLFAEQRLNAAALEGSVGVALRKLPREDGGVVPREEIAAAVKEAMGGEQGHAVRRKALELQPAAARAWSPKGSSRRALEEVAAKWRAAVRSHTRN